MSAAFGMARSHRPSRLGWSAGGRGGRATDTLYALERRQDRAIEMILGHVGSNNEHVHRAPVRRQPVTPRRELDDL
jgi:hypothetical protein